MTGTNIKRETRVSAMLAAAARHFMTNGYAATSMDEIAATVGVVKGAVYYYFPSKADLLYQIYSSVLDEMLARVGSIPDSLDAAQTLHETLKAMLQLLEDRPLETAVYLQEGPLLQQFLTRKQARELRVREAELTDHFHDLLEDGVKAGLFRPVDTDLAALALIGMAAWVRRWYSTTGRASTDDIATAFADLILGGLLITKPDQNGTREQQNR